MHPFTSQSRKSVAHLGEERLIAHIRRWLGPTSPRAPHGIGDDCAVLRRPLRNGLVTVDPVIFGRHFDARIAPAAVGAKLLKRNLSDIAAMGGRPVAAVIALTLDARTKLEWVAGFYRGLATTARQYGVAIVGGDVAQADGTLAASLTLLGEAPKRVLAREGARTGDWIFVTGLLGRSFASGHHHAFTPRLQEGAWLAARPDVRSMMDVSDGLAKDLPALTPAGAVAALEPSALPLRPGADLRAALCDGEDYELLFSLRHRASRDAFVAAWRRRFPRVRLTCLGQFVPANTPVALKLELYRGYEHLR